MTSAKENRPGAVDGADFGMSSFDGADTSESTATEYNTQELPTPRSYTGATGGTSQAAAKAVKPISSATCLAILDYLRRFGASSCEEVVEGLKLEGLSLLLNTARARICDLHKAGMLMDSGERSLGESGKCRVVRWRVI